MKTIFLVVLSIFLSNIVLGVTKDSSKTSNVFIELSPIASYDMGKCIRLNVGLNRNNHSWYVGIQSHLNISGDWGQPDNYVTHNNGYAKNLSNLLHLNAGYQRNFHVNRSFKPFFYVDMSAGKVGLVSKLYQYAGTDSSGAPYYFTSLSNSSYRLEDADFFQLSVGVGCRVQLSRAISLSSRVGLGEALVKFKYVGDVTETTIDHFIVSYSVGIQYNFK